MRDDCRHTDVGSRYSWSTTYNDNIRYNIRHICIGKRCPTFENYRIAIPSKLFCVELRKIHYNAMSRVMDMNEADILAGHAKSVSARHCALYELYQLI